MLILPANFLGVRRITGTAHLLNHEDATYIDILDDPGGSYDSYGITVTSSLPGLVPQYEEHSARLNAGYTLPQWRDLNWIDRAIEVATFRIKNKIESIQNEQSRDEANRK